MTPRVIDISHHNTVKDLNATAKAGIWGVIHKASQGRAYPDPDYAGHRALAAKAGLLWGAYHFGDGSDVSLQVDWFLKRAAPDANTLMVLDFEDNRLSNMSIQQAVQFLHLLEQKMGRKGAIYGGNRIKDNIGQLSPMERTYLLAHRLWLCQYGPKAVMPVGFKSYWLWQYTDGVVGSLPHSLPGISGELDMNVFDGTKAQLAANWA